MGAMSRKKLSKLRSGLGMLFQSGALLNWMTIKDNVALPLRDRGTMSSALINEKVMNVLEILGLKDDCQKMPSDISGGMRKRAGLARAVVTDPEIVLYDEPTSGLDPIMSRKIDKLVVSLKNRLNITSVVVTHDLLSAFNVADRIAMLADGKIQVCGTVKEFKDTDNPRVRAFINAFSAGIDGKEGFYA
jgi:phospholipid/cholesterol/gamma-HCH transport system ATP-binding protein